MPWRYIKGVQLSTGDEIEGRDWKPSGLHKDAKEELIHIMDQYLREKDRQFKELGYYTTTESLPRMEDWVDREFALQYQHGRSQGLIDGYNQKSWFSENWIPVLFFMILIGGMLLIGFTNGWS